MPKPTPFHARTSAQCSSQSWQEWSGYLTAISYDMDHVREYNAVRTACGLFDISPLYKYHVRGRDAQMLLDRVVTRDVSKCHVGQVMYTAWCNDDGKIIDDGTLARFEQDAYRLTAAIPTLDWLQDNAIGMSVDIEDVTDAYGALSLQGPTSRALLQQLASADLDKLRYFRVVDTEIADVPVRLSRTGYTGDLGYELFCEPRHAENLWDALAATGKRYGLLPAGNVALEMARIEAGLLLIEVDFVSAARTLFEVQKSTPYELGLDFVVKLDKPHFVGREALSTEMESGPAWNTVGLVLDIAAIEKRYAENAMPLHLPYEAWAGPVPVYADADQRQYVGKATCGTWSPILKQYVVIARVRPQYAKLGGRVYVEETVEGRRYAVPAEVVKMPFFDPPRKKD